MNQGKLEVVKQEMARVNIDVLEISKRKWTGMGEFIQMTSISTTVGRKPLEEIAIMVKGRVWNAVLGCNLKNNRVISLHFQGKQFNITVIQAYAPTSKAEEAEVEQFYEDLQMLFYQS